MPADQESAPFLDHSDPEDDVELQPFDLRPPSEAAFSSEHPGRNSLRSTYSRLVPSLLGCLRCITFTGHKRNPERNTPRRIRPLRAVWRICLILLVVLGVIQLATLVLGIAAAFFPEKFDYAYKNWHERENLDGLYRWPTDFTADTVPVACHSHNDYWRRVPLISAIKAGCTGVEADVWLYQNDLYVGHAESALTSNRTFRNLYVDPLVDILDRQNPVTQFHASSRISLNGVFDTDHSQTLVLLIDFKTDYEHLWPVVSAQLEPLRQKNYLSYFDGIGIVEAPVTVVVTGNAPFEYVVTSSTHRDMFFDAPLDMLASLSHSQPVTTYDPTLEEDYLSNLNNTSHEPEEDQNQGQGRSGHPPSDPATFTRFNSFYASVNFEESIKWPTPYLSTAQRDKIASQIAGAHSRGLKVRYWQVPQWPIGLRNYLWRELVKMGVDYLNVDDLTTATRGDWRSGWSIWGWSLWGGSDW